MQCMWPREVIVSAREPRVDAQLRAQHLEEALRSGRLPHDLCPRCQRWSPDTSATTNGAVACFHEAPAAADDAALRDQLAGAAFAVVDGLATDELLAPAFVAAVAAADVDVVLRLRAAASLRAEDLPSDLAERVVCVELTSDEGDDSDLAWCASFAASLGAKGRIRLVVSPQNWTCLPTLADAARARGLAIDVTTFDRDGRQPLSDLALNQLVLVRDMIGWIAPFYEGEAERDVESRHVHSLLREELRALAVALLDRGDAAEPAALALPALDGAWLEHPLLRQGWLRYVFGQLDSEMIAAWLRDVDTGEAVLRAHPWRRVLLHKQAWESRDPDQLGRLKQLYESEAAAELCREDEAFAEDFNVQVYGGPWGERLGLERRERSRPFKDLTPHPPTGAPPKVTVLVPSYRHGRFIERTLRSVLAQTAPDFKLLVVDDGSPDDTVAAASAVADERLEVRVNEENLGLGNSVLAALRSVDTPYVALLNSDDLFHPERLARCVPLLDEDDGAQVVTTDLLLIDEQDRALTTDDTSLVFDGVQVFNWVHWYADNLPDAPPKERLFEELLQRNFLATSSNLVARTEWLLGKEHLFQGLKYCLDWQIFLDAAIEGSLRHIPEALAGYRLHSTNTVWFPGETRWAFFLEVNRVLADALDLLLAQPDQADEDLMSRATYAVQHYIAENREADGLALFLNSALDGAALERTARHSDRVREAVQELARSAAERTARRDIRERAAPVTMPAEEKTKLQLMVSLTQEAIASAALRRRQGATEVNTLRAKVEDLATRLEAVRDRLSASDERVADLVQQKERLRAEITQERQRLDEVQERLVARRTQLQSATEDRERASARAKKLQEQYDQARRDLDHERAAAQELTSQLEEQELRVEQQRSDMDRVVRRRDVLANEAATLRGELSDLRASREFRTGNFLWNKLPLAYMSRRGKKWYYRLVDAKRRLALWAKGKLRSNQVEGVAVVAATWQWPIYSHTFVYQEMLALTHMGLEVKLFHWKANDFDQLQPAFAALKDGRVEMQPAMPKHRGDRDYWLKKHPGRLDAILQRVAAATGKTMEELYESPHVLRACTFARMAELAGATYAHSYDFYDQSFMTMITSWLLEIPRGVSCYADHMLDDYEFKLVGLQIELASVVVATSARIKQELVDIAGEEHADKIIVKPNGVNGERFPATDRGDRTPDDLFEVISISRLEPKKGLEYMIDAVAALKQQGRKIRVHIIGAVDTSLQASIEYGDELEHQIKELGLQDEVLLHGMMMHEQIQPIMQRSRAFVAPYVELESGDKDGIPTAMLEALASGLPIVTTDSGSILEVVQDGVQALVTPQRDSAAYAAALERLISDPQLERTLAKNARQRFDQEFDIKVTERRLHERVAAALQQTGAAR